MDASKILAADIADSLRTHCQKRLQFDCWIVVTGSICLQVDTGQKINLNLDQKVTKQSQESAELNLSASKEDMLEEDSLGEMATDAESDPLVRTSDHTEVNSDLHRPTNAKGKYTFSM